MTSTAPSNDEIRLTVMTDNDDSPSNVGEACIVDRSQGLEHVIDIVSATVGFDVERLDLLIYSGDRVVSHPRVKDSTELTDGCTVRAVMRQGMLSPSNSRSEGGEVSQEPTVMYTLAEPAADPSIEPANTGPTHSLIDPHAYDSPLPPTDPAAEPTANAPAQPIDVPSTPGGFAVGTKVRKLFDVIGWNNGQIVAVDDEHKRYKLFYSCGGVEYISFEDPQMSEIVLRGRTRGREVASQNSFYDSASDVEDFTPKKKVTKARTRHGDKPLLTEAQRQELQGIEISLPGYARYLVQGEGLCESNVKCCTRQISKLSSGEGISYHGWKNGTADFRPPAMDMSANFHQLWEDAKAHENINGPDRSGLVVRIPLQKLEAYQHEFYRKRNSKQDSEGSGKRKADDLTGADDDDGINYDDAPYGTPVKRSTEGKRIRRQPSSSEVTPLTFEERISLRGDDLDVGDFEKYLIQEEGLSDFMCGRYRRIVAKLKSSEGVSSRDWPVGVVFHPRPVDLSEDFQQLLQEYITHEARHGQSPFIRKYMMPLMQKLTRYQKSCYEKLSPQDELVTI